MIRFLLVVGVYSNINTHKMYKGILQAAFPNTTIISTVEAPFIHYIFTTCTTPAKDLSDIVNKAAEAMDVERLFQIIEIEQPFFYGFTSKKNLGEEGEKTLQEMSVKWKQQKRALTPLEDIENQIKKEIDEKK